jgi:hypothetical protein
VCAESLGAWISVCVMGVQVTHDVIVFTARHVTKSIRCPGRVACRLFVPCMLDRVKHTRHWVTLPPDGFFVLVKKENETWSGRKPWRHNSLVHSVLHFPVCHLFFFSRSGEHSFKKLFNNWHQSRLAGDRSR